MTRKVASGMLPDMNYIENRIIEGKLRVDDDGQIISEKPDGTYVAIGHEGNARGNRRLSFREEGQEHPTSVQAQRVAWRIHRGEWPPEDMSVMMVNGDKGDFRRENLMLVPRQYERRAKAMLEGKKPRKKAA